MSALEQTLLSQIKMIQLPAPESEHRFHKTRKWRFDFAYIEQKIAIEVEGGTWTGGRHTRGSGFEKDCEKYNEATADGWRVFRFTSGMIRSGVALNTIERVLNEAS